MIKICVEDELKNCLGNFQLGIIQANVICNESSRALQHAIDRSVSETREKYTLESVKMNYAIAATREAYKKTGNDPNRYRPSADSLIRRIVKGLDLYSVNRVVDVLNMVSIQTGYSISGFDKTKIQGKVYFGIGIPGEPYRGIGRGEVNISNLPVLRDETGAFGNPTSDSERTMITKETEEILFIFYDFIIDPELEYSVKYCLDLLKEFCSMNSYRSEIINF